MKGQIKSKEDIPNIMGFISQTEKTGVLTLVNKGDQVEVGFVKGRVNAAVYKRAGVQELIKEYLLNSGKISMADYQKISTLHKETRKPYEDILIHEKYINEQQWKDIIHFKIQEIIDELFTWESGSYDFIEDVIMYENSKVKIAINTQGLIMEGMRRIDEWPNIINALPSLDMVFDIKQDEAIPDNIGSQERRLLEIVHPSRDLKELIRISGLGKYITYQAIYNLLKMGIVIKTKKTRKRPAARKKKQPVMSGYHIVSWILILFFILLAASAGRFSFEYTYDLVTYNEGADYTQKVYARDNVDMLIRVYFIKQGRFPDTLDELVALQWIDEKIASDYMYINRGVNYRLDVK